MNIKFATIGSDPEFFVFDPKGRPYPATLFAKGTKENPIPINGMGFFEQRDNLSFEGNIPPAKNKLEFISSMQFLREYFEKKVAKFDYHLSPNGVEYFDKRYLKTPEGMEFGCSKVISSWDSKGTYFSERATPILSRVKYRVAGFHIHIGYRNGDASRRIEDIIIARLFDLFLTMPAQRIKPEPERLQSYGKYGMMRSKSYGVECRTLSSYFTQTEYLGWVWDQLMKMEEFINLCSEEDFWAISANFHFIGTEERTLQRIFYGIFDTFKNKEVLTKFNETNDIYSDKDLVPKVQRANPYNGQPTYYYTATTSGTSTASTY